MPLKPHGRPLNGRPCFSINWLYGQFNFFICKHMAFDVAAKLATHLRDVYDLKLLPRNDSSKLAEVKSSFGDQPYMQQGETWPTCEHCKEALDFVCQLDLSQTDLKLKYDLVVFFYCFECNPLSDVDGAFEVRTYRKPSLEKWQFNSETHEQVTQPCDISFRKTQCLPDWHGIQKLDKEITSFFNEAEEPEEAYENLVDTLIDGHGFTLVGPYPQWISGDATPACSRCQNTMSLLLQIDSEEAADLIWGNSGCAYLFFCEVHPKEIKFCIQF